MSTFMKTSVCIYIYSWITDKVITKWTFCVQQFFSAKVAIMKTQSATISFFSCPLFLLLDLSFSPFLFIRFCDFGASRD